MKILAVEDDEAIAMVLRYSLEKEGYEVRLAETYKEAKEQWKEDPADLVILDINLPDGNGYDLCRTIRQEKDVPMIFLTASVAEVNVVMGLELGADDYITKPFRINELLARIRAVLRRSGKSRTSDASLNEGVIQIQNVRIHMKEARVTVLDEESGREENADLTALEYRLLLSFYNNRGIVMERKTPMISSWRLKTMMKSVRRSMSCWRRKAITITAVVTSRIRSKSWMRLQRSSKPPCMDLRSC